jgi:hypothetical protein
MFPLVIEELETAVLQACCGEGEWPAQVAAGVYAGVDFVVERPDLARGMAVELTFEPASRGHYERFVGRLAGFIAVNAPIGSRPRSSVDETMVAGMVGLVGDHLRVGRLDRLVELRPELVLLTLLPYLGFAEAQAWANRAAERAVE